MTTAELGYERGYQAGYHAGMRSQQRSLKEPTGYSSDPLTPYSMEAHVVLSARWPYAAVGDVRTFGGRGCNFVWTGLSWKPLP